MCCREPCVGGRQGYNRTVMKTRYWIAGVAAAVAGGAAYILTNRGPRFTPRRYRLQLPDAGATETEETPSVEFIGTATTIIRFHGLTILTDPNFLHRGERVHIGYGMHSTRLTHPAIDFDHLPPIDLVVLSHLHEDHFDKLVE